MYRAKNMFALLPAVAYCNYFTHLSSLRT